MTISASVAIAAIVRVAVLALWAMIDGKGMQSCRGKMRHTPPNLLRCRLWRPLSSTLTMMMTMTSRLLQRPHADPLIAAD